MSSSMAEMDRVADALPDGWGSRCVAEAIAKRRGLAIIKLQTPDYLEAGALPIVDQGAKFICGYTDELDAAYPYDLPVIVFGDHTRTVKYIDFPFAVGADGTQCLHPSDAFDSRFFFYALENLDLRSEGYARHFKLLKEKVIAQPPLDEQRRIAEVLRSVDDAIAAKQAALKASKQFKRSCREAAVQRFQHCPPVALQAVLSSIDAGWSPDCDSEPAADGEWSILKTSAVVWDGYNDSENKRLPTRLVPRPSLEVAIDDILLTRAGPAERTGVVSIVRQTAGRRMLSDKIIRVRVSADNAVPLAIAELLSSDRVQAELVRSKTGMAASQTNISQKIVVGLEVHLPPLDDQQGFADEMAALQRVIERNEDDLRLTIELKAALLSDLLSGNVRVPE